MCFLRINPKMELLVLMFTSHQEAGKVSLGQQQEATPTTFPLATVHIPGELHFEKMLQHVQSFALPFQIHQVS